MQITAVWAHRLYGEGAVSTWMQVWSVKGKQRIMICCVRCCQSHVTLPCSLPASAEAEALESRAFLDQGQHAMGVTASDQQGAACCGSDSL